MKKTAVLIMIVTIASKIFGFLRDIVLSYFYGASNISDAYLIATVIPLVVFSFLGNAISTGFIPLYSEIKKKGDKEEIYYTNNVINITLILTTILLVVGLIFTDFIVKVFASGFEGETLKLAIRFTRISLVGMYFTGLVYIFRSYLYSNNSYVWPSLIAFPMNIIIIISIIISSKTNSIVLASGLVLSLGSQLFLLIPHAIKKGYKYKFIIDFKSNSITSMAYLAIPIIIGGAVNEINVLVDRTLASQIAMGGISALNYAHRLNGFINGIFVMSLATVMYPLISKMAAENNMTGLKKSILEAINGITLLVIPATIGAMTFAEPVVKLLFGRGEFDMQAISMTSTALFFYSIGMIGFGLREVLSRGFYSLQDTKTPMINAAIGMILNIVLNIILSKYMGIGGLALATSIAAIFTTLLLFISLRKKIGPFGMKQISISFLKILIASLVMGLFAKLSFNYLTANIFSQNISLIISIAIGAAIYFITIYFMKIEDVDVIVNALKKKIVRKAEAA